MKNHIKKIQLLNASLLPYDEASVTWGNASGIYAIWGNKELADKLRSTTLKIHTSKENKSKMKLKDNYVSLKFEIAINSAASLGTRKEKKFCLYVGKTANFVKRQKIRRFEKLLKPSKEASKALLKSTTLKALKGMLTVSFIEEDSWIDRFFLENIVIGLLRPALNTQPER